MEPGAPGAGGNMLTTINTPSYGPPMWKKHLLDSNRRRCDTGIKCAVCMAFLSLHDVLLLESFQKSAGCWLPVTWSCASYRRCISRLRAIVIIACYDNW